MKSRTESERFLCKRTVKTENSCCSLIVHLTDAGRDRPCNLFVIFQSFLLCMFVNLQNHERPSVRNGALAWWLIVGLMLQEMRVAMSGNMVHENRANAGNRTLVHFGCAHVRRISK